MSMPEMQTKSEAAGNLPAIPLETLHSRFEVAPTTGVLVSFRAKAAPEQEFILPAQDHPAFLIQYFDAQRQYQLLKAQQAESVDLQVSSVDGAATVTAHFYRVGGFDLDVITTVRAAPSEPFSRWQITVQNRAGLEIVDVQYPMVVCAYQLGGKPASEALLQPNWIGELVQTPNMERMGPDSPSAWQLNRENGSFAHYPGGQFAQLLAYYNDRAGLYLACDDTQGNVKRFKAVHRHPGLRLGVAHIGDWPAPGERTLEYDVLLETFQGDWYAAAGIYRDWSLRQHWAVPLYRRTDVPAWLLDSPPYITIRPQGVLDAGPVYPIDEFLPYEKCLPLLERISKWVKSPIVAVMMGWERGASWVYPDCFPPVGGDDSMRAFAHQARRRGWHVGSFCNGTRWVMAHHWNGYDGRKFFLDNHGAESICRLPEGQPWAESWDVSWRPSFQGCMGTAKTRQVASDFVRRLIDWGMESIQFFDQNCGATTFPCFARDHDHPPLPGKWMVQKMADTVAAFHAVAKEAGEEGIIHSTETCCNEFCLPLFQEADSRLRPPGHFRPRLEVVPLYQFLYHECIVLQGGMGAAPEPYHLQIRNANNGVTGEIPGGVMIGDGTLLDKDTENWANWEPKVGSDAEALEMIRVVTTMRREAGRSYLLYGRMQPPAAVRGVKTMRWKENGQAHAIPAVFHAAWSSPGGRHAVVLANWTNQPQPISLRDPRLKKQVVITTESSAAALPAAQLTPVVRGRLALTLPPLSITLVEAAR